MTKKLNIMILSDERGWINDYRHVLVEAFEKKDTPSKPSIRNKALGKAASPFSLNLET